MTATKTSRKQISRAGTALMRGLHAYAAAHGTTTIIADDISDLVATIDGLLEHEESHIKSAIRSLHHGGAIDCGHPGVGEYKNTPYEGGPRGYKIKLLIKASVLQ